MLIPETVMVSGIKKEWYKMAKPYLKMKNISKRFPGVKALDSVDFEVAKGEVLGLVGENGAGKSTLIKILTGAYEKDKGQIFIDGKEVNISNPRQAINAGIAAIYQELNLNPYFSAAENIFLGQEIKKGNVINFIDWQATERESKRLLNEMGQDLDVNMPVKQLGIGQQQMVEIAKALSTNANIIIMDEPTSSLSLNETEELLKAIDRLRGKGIAVIFISHRLEEVFKICDRITVMRDGKKIVTVETEETNKDEIIKYMVGRSLEQQYPKKPTRRGVEALRVENLKREGIFDDISFVAYSGEILGISGLVGAGRTEIARSIFGADVRDNGDIYVYGKKCNILSPRDAMREGIALLTEDRKGQGLILQQDIVTNVTLPSLPKFKEKLFINLKKLFFEAKKLSKELNIKTPSLFKKVMELSGGNQQKVVIAKWLCYNAKIFIFDEPTRGIDVGAKVEVYNIMNELVSKGACVIMISSELPEILGMSDRVIVIHEGRITGEFFRENANQEMIMKAATGGV